MILEIILFCQRPLCHEIKFTEKQEKCHFHKKEDESGCTVM